MELLRIKEICKQKGITMQEIAGRLGISNVNLSASLNKNPTLNRLKEVADVLGVEVWQLFKKNEDISGIVQYRGVFYSIENYQNILDLAEKIKNNSNEI